MYKVTCWHCDYCRRILKSGRDMKKHESKCMYNPETRSCGTCENLFRNSADGITASIPQCKEGLMKTDPNSKMNPWGMRTQCEGYVKKSEGELG